MVFEQHLYVKCTSKLPIQYNQEADPSVLNAKSASGR